MVCDPSLKFDWVLVSLNKIEVFVFVFVFVFERGIDVNQRCNEQGHSSSGFRWSARGCENNFGLK